MSVLDQQSKLNASAALYAPASGGGGGGGAGPNPAFSTITINDGVLTTNSGANGFVFQNSTTPVIQDAFLQSNTVPLAAGTGTANTFQLNSISGSNNTLTIGAGNDNASYIWTGGGGSQDGSQALYIQAAGVSISSLTVSSINGAVPGGGGGSSGGIAVSSITSFPGQANPSTILMAPGAGGSFALTGNPLTANLNGDIILDTSISANALTSLFQPGGTANAALLLSPGGTGTNLNMGATDAGGAVIAAVDTVSGNPSTLTLVSNNFKFAPPATLNGTLSIFGADTNLIGFNVNDSNNTFVSGYSVGTVGGRNQMYIQSNAQIQSDLWVSSISRCAAATVSSFTVSSINGVAPGSSLTNNAYPFTTGSDSGGTWQLTVASNTAGVPQYLTNSITTNPANSYLVSVNLVSGSNTDTATTSITKLALSLSGGNDVQLGSFPGFSNFWIYNGTVGSKTAIVRGASAIRLYAWAASPTNSTDLFFDTTTGMSITNLGPSS